MEIEKYLNDLKPGSKGKIKKVDGQGNLKRRLLDMGILPGSPVEVIKLAPLGDPVDIKIKGYHLSLRKEEAKQISVIVEAL